MHKADLLRRLLNEQKVRGVLFGDLLALMTDEQLVGCEVVGNEGACVCLKHPDYHRRLDLRDNGQRAMLGSYVDDAAKYLRALRDGGMING